MTTKRKSKSMKYLDSLTGGPLCLGDLILSIRNCEGMSQVEFAKILGISKSHLCDIENNRKSIAPARAIKFAKILGYSQRQFVRLSFQEILDKLGVHMKVDIHS